MKKALILVLAALAISSVGLAAARPAHSASAPKVMYVLKGTLSTYAAYAPATTTNGTITILVNHSNYHARALKGMTLTFGVGAKTQITMNNGTTAIVNGNKGIVKIRAAKKIAAADLATTLQAAVAKQIIDNG